MLAGGNWRLLPLPDLADRFGLLDMQIKQLEELKAAMAGKLLEHLNASNRSISGRAFVARYQAGGTRWNPDGKALEAAFGAEGKLKYYKPSFTCDSVRAAPLPAAAAALLAAE